MDVVANGVPFVPVLTGAKAGIDPEEGKAVIQVVSWLDDDTALIVHVAMSPDQMEPGTLNVDWIDTAGYAVQVLFPPEGEPELVVVGIVGDGTLELSAASTDDGATVSGSISTLLYEQWWE
jgi:hypothetical protein